MIAGCFHKGSGLGNQLARYVAVRTLSLDKGFEFGMINPEDFKGKDFMNLDMGVPVKDLLYEFHEAKVINADGWDVRPYDEKIKDVQDFTLIDGEFQAPEYFMHRLDEVREWLKVDEIYPSERTCIINFRGGEYTSIPSVFLPQKYWDKAIAEMRTIRSDMVFIVTTDDVETASKFFPNFEIGHDLRTDYTVIQFAPYVILSNSSFAIFPALLNTNVKKVIAPRYWAGYNKGYWQLPQNNYKRFTYIHHNEN